MSWLPCFSIAEVCLSMPNLISHYYLSLIQIIFAYLSNFHRYIQRNKIISIPPFSPPTFPGPSAHLPDLHIDKRWQMAVSGVKHHLYGKSHLCLLSFLSLGSNLCVASMSFFLYCRISSTDYTECKTLKHEHCLNNQVLKHTLRNTKGWLVILGWLKHVTLSCALWCIGIKANRPCANRIYLISSLISFTSVTWAFFFPSEEYGCPQRESRFPDFLAEYLSHDHFWPKSLEKKRIVRLLENSTTKAHILPCSSEIHTCANRLSNLEKLYRTGPPEDSMLQQRLHRSQNFKDSKKFNFYST